MKPTITIDARMIHSAGIGTYLQSLLPLILRRRPQYQFCLLGKAADLEVFPWARLKNTRVIPCDSPIYGLREQLEIRWKTPPETSLFWSPHYNIPLTCPAQLLVTVHDVFHLAMPQYTGGLHKRLYAHYMFSSLRKQAAAILSVSRFSKDELLKYTGQAGCQPQVVYNGVDESWFKVRKKRNPHLGPYFLYVGSVKPHKNLTGLLEAFEKVKDQIPQDLVIVGKKRGLHHWRQESIKKGGEIRGQGSLYRGLSLF
jgi:glycosyltransferase involved in cell wall biosynthesis